MQEITMQEFLELYRVNSLDAQGKQDLTTCTACFLVPERADFVVGELWRMKDGKIVKPIILRVTIKQV